MLVEGQKTEQPMVEPTVICPSCKKEIRLRTSGENQHQWSLRKNQH